MNRILCAEIFYYLLKEKGFKRGEKLEKPHLSKKVVTSLGLVSRINISFEKKRIDDGDVDLFSLCVTDSYVGNYFTFKDLEQFKTWFECMDIVDDYEPKESKQGMVLYVAPYGYFQG